MTNGNLEIVIQQSNDVRFVRKLKVYKDKTAYSQLWNINGLDVELNYMPEYKQDLLGDTLNELSINLKEKKPFSKISKKIGRNNVIVLIYNFYIVEFLECIEFYLKESLKGSDGVTLDDFLKIYIDSDFTLTSLQQSKRNIMPQFRKILLSWITSERIVELDIKGALIKGNSLIKIVEVLCINDVSEIIYNNYLELLPMYIEKYYSKAIIDRQLPSWNNFIVDTFGSVGSLEKNDTGFSGKKEFKEYIRCLCEKNECESLKKLISSNTDSMKMNKDKWILYQCNPDLSYTRRDIVFENIKSEIFKKELKWYYKYGISKYMLSGKLIKDFNEIGYLSRISDILNYLYLNRDRICFNDITSKDVVYIMNYLEDSDLVYKEKEKLKPATISKLKGILSKIVEYLMDNKYSTIAYTVPSRNIFSSSSMRNISNLYKETEVIPDHVLNLILDHLDELNPYFQNAFHIFNGTGLRAKEVMLLEEDCLSEGDNSLLYTPYKVLVSRRRNKMPDRRKIFITENLHNLIKRQIDLSSGLRKKYKYTYIFIGKFSDFADSKVRVKGRNFSSEINKLIKKHNIRDLDGELWNFATRQIRVKVIETMISNDATSTEFMSQLGHIDPNTYKKYYHKMEKKKLAELNSEFFKQQFELEVGKEQLKLYTEEERKALYVDFALKSREVEFGQCTKHMSEGKCGKCSGGVSCATCTKICTGIQYLTKWEKLLKNQQEIVLGLESAYKKEGILLEEYSQFIEYKREVKLLECYESVVVRIKE